mgnify:CR=1 FL=1
MTPPPPPPEGTRLPEHAIAIVGMAAHLPGAYEIDAFWHNLRDGVESIRRFTDDELESEGVDPGLLRDPHYVKANGVLDRMEWFDAGFFGLSPLDAAVMDPQTRHFLECTWHALEDSGHVPESFEGNIGVFAGAGAAQYFWKNVVQDAELMDTVGYFLLRHTGNDKDFVATRASYEFDLKGPSVTVQTACSTSLVAVHLACQSLLSWECDMALAGGVTIEQPHYAGYKYEEGEILSPDGHCRSFDSKSQGTVFGSGAGVVVLRRLEDALADGDEIHAVIRGTAINNDGAGKVSYLAPSVDGQAKVIAEALTVADVDARSIGMVEAHGTGTPVGDPIEVTALTQAFRTQTEDVGFCALGSVKSNIGHLDTAAGVASLIKATLAVKHGEIPPTVHFEQPNPLLNLESSPFFINAEAVPWPEGEGPRRAGVSSLGVGGTNAHIIVEEAPRRERPDESDRPFHLLTLSGRSSNAVEDASRQLLNHLEELPEGSLADIGFTLAAGRRRFGHRRSIVASSVEDAIEKLATSDASSSVDIASTAEGREVAFLFAGGGAQYPNMGRALYETEPLFREVVDRCLSYLEAQEDLDLRPLLFAPVDRQSEAARELQRPSLALPALFTIQYAQARLWMSWGIEPTAMIGHSMGEYTAACLADVMSMEDALSIVVLRGRLFEQVERGGMLSVSLGEDELASYLGADLSIAAINAPEVSVAAGPVASIDELEGRLSAAGVDARRIRIDVAAHSSMLDPILEEFRAGLQTRAFSPPKRKVISNLTGEIAGDELADPDYWVRHLRQTVRFADGLGHLLATDGPLLLEVGPGRTLATVARMHPSWSSDQPTLSSLPHPSEPSDALAFQLGTLGALWGHGADPDWEAVFGSGGRRRLSLPGYPFQREPHFVQPPLEESGATSRPRESEDDTSRREDIAEWFYKPQWTPTLLPDEGARTAEARILVLTDVDAPGSRLADRLEAEGHHVTVVHRGDRFERDGASFTVRPDASDDWKELLEALHSDSGLPSIALHTWSLGEAQGATLDEEQAAAFFAPLYFFQALESTAPNHALDWIAVTTGVLAVSGTEILVPPRALLLGPVRVAPKEMVSLKTRLVDVGDLPRESGPEARLWERLASEVTAPSAERILAYRGSERWTVAYAPRPVEAAAGPAIADGATVLITGGLGGIGLEIAGDLAQQARVNLALSSRRGLPPRDEWPRLLAERDENDKTSRAIREILAIEAQGSSVAVFAVDVTDPDAMGRMVGDVTQRFGRVDGVIHAAGTLDDGPLLAREADQARAVLDPKVAGTEALRGALQGESPTFVVLFSSVSAVIGAPGQIDYAAANAFLDAYAREWERTSGTRVVSLAWGAWKDVGMAAELAGEVRYDRSKEDGEDGTELSHPFFEVRRDGPGDERAVASTMGRDRHWMLEEHQVRDGPWVLPGSGYVELLRAARHELLPDGPFAFRDLVFVSPFRLEGDEARELEIRLQPVEGGHGVLFRSRKDVSAEWVDHATAFLPIDGHVTVSSEELSSVVDRLGSPEPFEQPTHPFMNFGPRWSNIIGQSTNGEQALLQHELPESFIDDLRESELHPALLDMATAGAQHLVPGVDPERDFLVPTGYGALRMSGPLQERITSHIRLTSAEDGGMLASFDVTIYGEDGSELVAVKDFSMIRVMGDGLQSAASDTPSWLEAAISPAEGREVMRRVLARGLGPHVFVATRPLPALIAEAAAAPLRQRPAAARVAPTRVLMPEVSDALVAHDAVAEAAALGTPGDVESPRVVGFIVYRPGEHATVSELRRFVRDQLDRNVVPQNFVEMVALPRDGDGAIRTEELRDPFAAVDDYVAPRTVTEDTIATIWSDLLALDRVGIHDNFLDVGGHSLVGIRVLLRIQQETGVRLEANALTMQTLEQLAAEVDRTSGQGPVPLEGAADGESMDARESTGEPADDEAATAPQTDSDAGRVDDGEDDSPGEGFLSKVKRAVTKR